MENDIQMIIAALNNIVLRLKRIQNTLDNMNRG